MMLSVTSEVFEIFVFVVFVFVVRVAAASKNYYQIVSNFTGTHLSSDTVGSTTICLSNCHIHESCEAIRYFESNKTCSLYTDVWNSLELTMDLTDDTTDRAYMKDCPGGWKALLDSCYYVRMLESDWKTAKEFCESRSSHLAVITSQAEQDAIVEAFNTTAAEAIWIGGIYNVEMGSWQWINGERWSYENYCDYCLHRNNEYCMDITSIVYNPERMWNPHLCSANKLAICEKDIQ